MSIKEQIYQDLLKAEQGMSATEIVMTHPEWYQSYVSRVLGELLRAGRVTARKDGRMTIYAAADRALDEDVALKDLHEDTVWDKFRKTTQFLGQLTERAENILYFAFTEMLNNAIDHSGSGSAHIMMERDGEILRFTIRDYGVGVFNSVMTRRHLPDEVTAIQELLKGKVTTMPLWHSGEGIFWTSKVADKFALSSYGYRLVVDNNLGDYAVERLDESVLGTEVLFEISAETDKSLQKLFREYTFDRDGLTLDTTIIPVRLYEAGEVWISRSQARRVMEGLERYRKVILDFKGLNVIGQGFADQIFRVWHREHPEVILEPINMSESVALMVGRARRDAGEDSMAVARLG